MPGELRRALGFNQCIGGERVARLLRLGELQLGGGDDCDFRRRQQLADFARLAFIMRRYDERIHARPSAFFCSAESSVMPCLASAIKAWNSSSPNGFSSAVVCTSTM